MPRASANFTFDELTRSSEHPELVTPFDELDPGVVVNLMWLVGVYLQPLRDAVGPVWLESGYRGPLLNRAVGSTSPVHPAGLAADHWPLEVPVFEVWPRLVRNELEGVDFDRLTIYPSERRLHVDVRPPGETQRRLLYVDEGDGWHRVSAGEALAITEG